MWKRGATWCPGPSLAHTCTPCAPRHACEPCFNVSLDSLGARVALAPCLLHACSMLAAVWRTSACAHPCTCVCVGPACSCQQAKRPSQLAAFCDTAARSFTFLLHAFLLHAFLLLSLTLPTPAHTHVYYTRVYTRVWHGTRVLHVYAYCTCTRIALCGHARVRKSAAERGRHRKPDCPMESEAERVGEGER